MELYNTIIKNVEELLGSSTVKSFNYDEARCWKDTGSAGLVMLRDAAFELGGGGKPSANFACVTTDAALFGTCGCADGAAEAGAGSLDGKVPASSVIVVGPDLQEIKGSVPFARIAVVLVKELIKEGQEDTEPVFRAIQDIDFVKYHVYPEGYMVRTSSDSNKEQVRVSKEAVSKGVSFERIGCSYIARYKANPNVLAVKIFFITAEDANYAQLSKDAKTVHDITMTLSKILEGLPTDCSTCGLKPICDEVEGMKELHFGKKQ